eukprot:TRINITY_DN18964_c0_g2_i4.p3 TRINITY_DN18964_c0_g2~~TRINITY_DN18964_c0_g2_i4.p3  ORF type:complete len:115 (-),score=19.50 TRINITY_DN18964_c0_g2_i4:438-782(-)
MGVAYLDGETDCGKHAGSQKSRKWTSLAIRFYPCAATTARSQSACVAELGAAHKIDKASKLSGGTSENYTAHSGNLWRLPRLRVGKASESGDPAKMWHDAAIPRSRHGCRHLFH